MAILERARYGATALAGLKGKLPNAFPRIMGPNALKYLQEVVDSGLTIDMTGRFERAFAETLGVRHCIAAPGCTPSLAMLANFLGVRDMANLGSFCFYCILTTALSPVLLWTVWRLR